MAEDIFSTADYRDVPKDMAKPLQALWWIRKGEFRVGPEWEEAHIIVQAMEGVPEFDWVHALLHWIDQQPFDGLFSCSSVARANPALDTLTPTASGVLAVKLSIANPDYLVWFRKEQLLTVTWAGDPSKPVVGNEPFGVILPDDLIWNKGHSALRQMADLAAFENSGVIAVEEVPREQTNKYGIVDAILTSLKDADA